MKFSGIFHSLLVRLFLVTLPFVYCSAQSVTINGVTNQKIVGISTSSLSISGSTNPATCTIGQIFFNTTSTPGQNLWYCTSTNTWTQQLLGTGLTNPMNGPGQVVSSTTGGTPVAVAGNTTTVPGFLVGIGNGTTASAPTFIPSTSAVFAENVLMHGVTGNCSTDDTSAIQAVLNTYPIVYFPRAPGGCYKISAALVMKSNQRIIGSGFQDNGIKQTSTTADAIDAKASLSGSRDIEIDNLNITDGVLATRTAGHGIWIDGTGDTAILHLQGNQIYGFEDGEHLVNPITSYVIGDRSNNAKQNSFSVTGPSTSTNFISTYGDAPGNHCYNIGDLQYSAFLGTACDAATVDGYHFYAESGGRPKNITLIPAGNETAGRYGVYTEGQSFSIINAAISGIPTGSGNACYALMNAVQITIQGGQCNGGDYAVNVLGDPTFLPNAYQGTNRVQDLYAAGQAIAVYHDPSGYLNISSSKRNFSGSVPVVQQHEVTTPMMLATAKTITGILNYSGQAFIYAGTGTYGTSSNETGTTLTFTLNACDTSTCTGTRKILATWATASVGSTTADNPYSNSWNIHAGCQVVTTGSTGTLMCHGTLIAATAKNGAPVTLNDTNTTTTTLDTTAQWYVGIMVQKSSILDTTITQDTNNVNFQSY